MIKTLRITTILAAFMAVGFLAFPMVYGYRGDEQIEKFLKSPGAIERFKKAKGAKRRKTTNQVSPLVRQAMEFKEYLDPTRKPAAPTPTRTPVVRKPAPITEAPVIFTTKFTLIGTSYYASRPDLSLAYIDEPGKGLHWVRQGAKVAHLLIQEVQDGSVIVKDRDKTVTLVANRAPKKSLLKSDKTSKSTTTVPGATVSITGRAPAQANARKTTTSVGNTARSVGGKPAATAVPPRSTPRVASSVASEMSETEQDAVFAEFIQDLKDMQAKSGESDDSGYSAEEKAAFQEAIVELEAMRITNKEVQRLDRLGRELRRQSDAELAKSSKVQSSTKKQQPPPQPQPPRTSQPSRVPQPPRRRPPR